MVGVELRLLLEREASAIDIIEQVRHHLDQATLAVRHLDYLPTEVVAHLIVVQLQPLARPRKGRQGNRLLQVHPPGLACEVDADADVDQGRCV